MQTIEKRAGIKIGCPEEAAFRQGFVSLAQLEKIVGAMPNCEYRAYLENEVIAEAKRRARYSRLNHERQYLRHSGIKLYLSKFTFKLTNKVLNKNT